ncbi:MAG: twin-arginine translocase subunit TatC [bacterium]|nr:twin-arginine translocase subunit TatC [bacterium]
MTGRRPPPDAAAPEAPVEKPFIEHLEDLRRTLFTVLAAFGVAFAVCLPLTIRGYTVAVLMRPLGAAAVAAGEQAPSGLPTLSPAGGVAAAMKIAAGAALVLALPFMLYAAGMFILPALTRRERRLFAPALIAGAALFYAGMAFCYFTTLPLAIRFLWNFNRMMGIENLWTINEYTTFVTRLLLAFGLVFELPLVVIVLVALGILDRRTLSAGRGYAIVSIFVLAAVLTPPDAVSQVMMAVPMLLLYEACIAAARVIESRAGRPR